MSMADQISQLERENKDLRTMLDAAMEERQRDLEHHREQLEALASKNFPFDWHRADLAYGKPICLAGNSRNTEGFSLELYANKEGDIIGGVLMDRDDHNKLDAFGMVPAEVVFRLI